MPRSRASGERERGSASLEFLAGGVLLLVPLVYLVVALAAVQGAALAADGAARHAARVFVLAADEAAARSAVGAAVRPALADFGIPVEAAEVRIECGGRGSCLRRGAAVTVRVSVHVPLPLLPPALTADLAPGVSVEAAATQRVSRFWAAP